MLKKKVLMSHLHVHSIIFFTNALISVGHKVGKCEVMLDTMLDFAVQSLGHPAVLLNGALLEHRQRLADMAASAHFHSTTHGVLLQTGPLPIP